MAERFDVIVIGTGFGGAVTACRLAQAGARVLILERGRRWTPETYPRAPGDPWLYWHDQPQKHNGWLDLRLFKGMAVAQGAGVGGRVAVLLQRRHGGRRGAFRRGLAAGDHASGAEALLRQGARDAGPGADPRGSADPPLRASGAGGREAGLFRSGRVRPPGDQLRPRLQL